ncbi:MAG: transcription termination factor NusA [Candidatus Promineifilaceae bacterium]|nr:transcription termination factor NusA [Candidatus Promineifilaceae bacterium]
MRSEFIVAFNEICEERGLAKDVVFEALKTALASAYRRNVNVSNSQDVRVEIDQRTGEPTIYAEKEVVDSIIDDRTEVLLDVARRQGHTDAEYGDTVMVESTPRNFGRIAAQTAKQVILQRVREAEREQLYDEYSGREGEIINGTIQSVGGQHITIGLDRTEAIMPRSQQVRNERYRPHDKIRVYLLEVRRTNRGPQIVVSRNHRNLLRRLLELEVPEIYNGQVDIKSIAREAGQRSKVAVMALQEGVDPVGACVGMRGVRIQSIVRELNDEKIDIIEYDPDSKIFIAKALSPARVSQVHLDDHPDEGRTAIVIVPDDQLSLAIGREGQNARLAAKLTGWRIDIKSLTESASYSLDNLDHPAVDPRVVNNAELLDKVRLILAKKEADRPVTAEDYLTLDRFVAGVEGQIIEHQATRYEEIRQERQEARERVPEEAWDLELEEVNLPLRLHNLLMNNEVTTVGDVLYYMELDGDALQERIEEVETADMEVIQNRLAELLASGVLLIEAEAPVEAEAAEVAPVAEAPVAEAVVEEEAIAEAEPQPVAALEAEAVAEEEAAEEAVEIEEATEVAPEAEEEEEVVPAIDDLSTSLIDVVQKPEKEERKGKVVVVSRPGESQEEAAEEDEEAAGHKGKRLVYDEEAGRVVTQRKRKRGRRRPEWEDFEDMDIDEVLDER